MTPDEKVKPKSCPKCGTKREQYDPRLDGSGRIVWDKCPNCGYDYCGHDEKVKPKCLVCRKELDPGIIENECFVAGPGEGCEECPHYECCEQGHEKVKPQYDDIRQAILSIRDELDYLDAFVVTLEASE